MAGRYAGRAGYYVVYGRKQVGVTPLIYKSFCVLNGGLLFRYVGVMKEGSHEGQGVMQYHNGDTYTGDVMCDV